MPSTPAQFAFRLARAAVTVDKRAEEVKEKNGARLAAGLSADAPRLTGRLAASIRHVGKGVVEVGVDYGGYVWYGTARQAPNPWGRPTMRRLAPKVSKDTAEAVLEDLLR